VCYRRFRFFLLFNYCILLLCPRFAVILSQGKKQEYLPKEYFQ
jgi:hypothetical protein